MTHVSTQSPVRDWRIGTNEELVIKAYTLPKTIARKCIFLTKKLGLNFGAIDLVQDKQGKAWFLEINPNGQWAFIEEKTGQPIGRAIAALLEARNVGVPSLG